jgi:rubredoxin
MIRVLQTSDDTSMDEETLYQRACIEGRCPECGGKTRRTDKDTSSGRDMREYSCVSCNWSHTFDVGEALWKILSDGKNNP